MPLAEAERLRKARGGERGDGVRGGKLNGGRCLESVRVEFIKLSEASAPSELCNEELI